MKRIIESTLVLLFLLVLKGSIFSQEFQVKPEFIEESYDIGIEESIDITIASNKTTGYAWHLVNSCEGGIVEEVNYRYELEKDTRKEKKLGAGGNEIWTVKGTEAGSVVLKFEYFQVWKPDEIKKVKFFRINVSDVLQYPVPSESCIYELKVGGQFEIPIPANHTTLYKWAWLNENKTDKIEKINMTYTLDQPPSVDGEMIVGGGGVEHWYFKALKPGSVTLQFIYTPRGLVEGISTVGDVRTYHIINQKN